MIFELITWATTALGIIGAILNAQKKISGFYVWSVANIVWIIVDVYKGIYAQAGYFAFLLGICIYGIHEWRRK